MKTESFRQKVDLELEIGPFMIRTISTSDELSRAFALRYQVFQVEMIGHEPSHGEDQDEFDFLSDHLAIFNSKTNEMVATCRLNCSLFSHQFYSAEEFECEEILKIPEVKLEIGRVCVHREFRNSIVVMLLWRAIAAYMVKTKARFLFGCGSVSTLDSRQAVIVYRYLKEQGKVREDFKVSPKLKYRSSEFEKFNADFGRSLSEEESKEARKLLPSLCKSYFDIGCFTPGIPAFDREFKCIDFLTILDVNELSPRVRKKMLGGTL